MTYQPLSPEQAHIPPAPQPETPAEPRETPQRGNALELVERVSGVAVPLAVGLYAMLYLGFQDVYEVFGITPEQAGLDQATIFARLLSTLVQVLLLLLPVVGLLVGLAWLFNTVTRGALGRTTDGLRERPWIAAVIAVVISGAGYWAYFLVAGTPFSVELPSGGQAALFAVIVAVFGLLIPFRLMRKSGVGRAGSKVLSGVLFGVGLGFFLNIMMYQGADDIHTNGNGNPFLEIVGFKNQWVVVQDGDGKDLKKNDDMMMLLGEKEGAYVLYDCGSRTTLRRPIEATILDSIVLNPDFTDGGKQEAPACGYDNEEQTEEQTDEQPAG